MEPQHLLTKKAMDEYERRLNLLQETILQQESKILMIFQDRYRSHIERMGVKPAHITFEITILPIDLGMVDMHVSSYFNDVLRACEKKLRECGYLYYPDIAKSTVNCSNFGKWSLTCLFRLDPES